MKRTAWMAAAAALAFLIVMLARFPVRWAAGLLPRGTTCAQLGGTLWSGTCTGLLIEGMPLGDLSWSAHPLELLAGKISLSMALALPSGTARSLLTLSPTGALTAQGVRASVPLNRALFGQLPPNTQGLVGVDLALLRWDGKRITALRGELEVHGLSVQGELLGDYRVSFPADPGAAGGSGDEPTGRLEDLGGPLAVQGTVRLTREPGFVVEGLIAPRANAPRDIVEDIRFLGSPDAQGRRPFTVAETF
ncbi:MAG TPA: type II secretion system protein N [Steroidobacteraceae bacterium]|nr:type II secretion system protein N [Steroidobacteraceae bacterium]